MSHIYTREPLSWDKKAVLEFRKEMIKANILLQGTGGLEFLSTYRHWMKHKCKGTKNNPATQYIVFECGSHKIIGMINCKWNIDPGQFGHISYCVRPTEQGKGYATQMLKDALCVYEEKGYKEVFVSCAKNNIASRRVVEKVGGVVVEEFIVPPPYKPEDAVRYRITYAEDYNEKQDTENSGAFSDSRCYDTFLIISSDSCVTGRNSATKIWH